MFPSKFEKDLYGKHFRKLIKEKDISTNVIGNTYSEIDTFLKVFDVSEEFRDKVAVTIAELVGNAIEHARSDCLLDIDVTSPYEKKDEDMHTLYYGVNLAVLNFSDKLLGDGNPFA